jgi:hypothetical protein
MPHSTGASNGEDRRRASERQGHASSGIPHQTVVKNRRKAYLDRHGKEYFSIVELELEGERFNVPTRVTKARMKE